MRRDVVAQKLIPNLCCAHQASKDHHQAALLQLRFDWLLGPPLGSNDCKVTKADGTETWDPSRLSLRGQEKWPPGEESTPGMVLPLSKNNIRKFWGANMEIFGLKVMARLREIPDGMVTLNHGKKNFKIPVRFIKECTPCVVEYGGIFFRQLYASSVRPLSPHPPCGNGVASFRKEWKGGRARVRKRFRGGRGVAEFRRGRECG